MQNQLSSTGKQLTGACSQLLRGHLELGEREEIAGDRKFAATIAFEGD
jgi:hypothetical protein